MYSIIYKKSISNKLKIIKYVIESSGEISKKYLTKKLKISIVSLSKYLSEICDELPKRSMFITSTSIFFDNTVISFEEIQKIYFSKSISSDILYNCFFKNGLTLEQLADHLYVSDSKLFNVLIFLNRRLATIKVSITKSPYITLSGNRESLIILYNLFLKNTDYRKTFFKYDYHILENSVIQFLVEYNINIDSKTVTDLSLWILTISSRDYLNKFNSPDFKISLDFISLDSPVLTKIREYFSYLNENALDSKGCLLILIYLVTNMSNFRFKNCKYEYIFFNNEIITNYKNKGIVTSILKEIDKQFTKPINVIIFKLEICIHFFKLLYPYYRFFIKRFSPKLYLNDNFKKTYSLMKKSISNSYKYYETRWLSEILASLIIAFQKKDLNSSELTIAVYSIRGLQFEEFYCAKLKQAIKIIPYSELNNSASVLLIDDIDLLSNLKNYNRYVLLEEEIVPSYFLKHGLLQ